MVQRKYLILILPILLFFSCAHKEIIKEEIKEKEIIEEYKEPEKKVEFSGSLLLFLSKNQTDGDLYFYDIQNNLINQLSFINNSGLKIYAYSDDLKFILIADENFMPYIFLKEDEKLVKIKNKNYNYELLNIKQACWITNNLFFCLGSDGEYNDTIFKVYIENNEAYYQQLIESLSQNIVSFSVSHNKSYLAYYTENSTIEIFNLKNFDTKKLITLNSYEPIYILWDENNDSIYYTEKNILYKLDFAGFNKIISLEENDIYKIYQNRFEKYKIYYTIKNNDVYNLFVKNLDRIGKGDFVGSIKNLKDLFFFSDEILFYDTFNNEIYSLNLKTLEEKFLFSNSALFYFATDE